MVPVLLKSSRVFEAKGDDLTTVVDIWENPIPASLILRYDDTSCAHPCKLRAGLRERAAVEGNNPIILKGPLAYAYM